ncbi:T9SS C-terminal target domain-containing protein [Paludibacter sp. 221]|uniref:leucine-rich repeat protein n=1 Tax=Paludibacter sp. 221 TaxID=2302939 RepID=UPI0013D13750|nr:leucine-rich repeat protein [Paludibacter sp. 221]NDV47152.1 T9SS C-terminal target domain-containing protein [Paludibacter sp. 221]
MKKIYLVLVLCLIAGLHAWGQAVKVDDVWYEFAGEEATASYKSIGEYTGDIVIPSTVEYEGKTYTVTAIKSNSFGWCGSLQSVQLPNTIKTIGNSAFYASSKLTSVNIPDGVQTIGEESFAHTSLLSFDIPRSVTTIGEKAFASNRAGTYSVTVHWENPNEVTLEADVFSITAAYGTLNVPDGTEALYEAADQWKDFKKLQTPTGLCGIESLGISVYAAEGQLVIDNAEGNTVLVYNMQGQKIASAKALEPTLNIPLSAGIYVVCIKDATQKVIVK